MLPQNENLDLALLPRTFNELADHLYFPARLILSDQDVTALNVGIGDEVFACGLFSIHPGENRILPVVRVGTVSRYPAEKLRTEKFGTIDAFLIELRSLGGLSGSPVFIHLGSVRQIQGQVMQSAEFQCRLFGIIHGHFDIRPQCEGMEAYGGIGHTIERVNTGMAAAVPAYLVAAFYDECMRRLKVA